MYLKLGFKLGAMLTCPTHVLTIAAFLPEAQVQADDVPARPHVPSEGSHLEYVILNVLNVVPVVTQHSSQRCLLDFSELGRGEDTGVSVPEPAWGRGQKQTIDLYNRLAKTR